MFMTKLNKWIIAFIIPFFNIALTSCDKEDNDESIITGSWYSESITNSISRYELYVFKNNGEFNFLTKFRLSGSSSSPSSFSYNGKYSVYEDIIHITLDDGTEKTGTYTLENDILKIKMSDGAQFSGTYHKHYFTTLDDVVIGKSYLNNSSQSGDNTGKDNPPYANYMYCTSWGGKGYVELTKVEMQCEHGKGTEPNYKYLRFFGANGQVSPNGAVILYTTPYYEGIDKYWSDGTYKVNIGSGLWHYIIHPYINGYNACNQEHDGKLTIKSSGNIMVIDYKSDDIIMHFSGTVSK